MTPQELKNSILQLAIQGKLVEQRPEEGTGEELFQQIQAEGNLEEATTKRRGKKGSAVQSADQEDPFDIPDTWKWVKLGHLGYTNIGLTYSPKDVRSAGVIVLRSSNIQDGKMDYDDLVKVSCEIPDNKMCHIGDILICARNGSKRLVGKAAIIDKEGMSFGAFMAIFRSICNPYILHVINSAYFRNTLLGDTGTTTISQITQDMLKNVLIPLPPLAEQMRIVTKLEEILPLIDRYEAAWNKLEEFNKRFPNDMQKSILQLAIQGKLVEQRPDEGTGEDLFKKLVPYHNGLKSGKSELNLSSMEFDIPESWTMVELNQLFNFVDYRGKTPTKISQGVFLITASNIRQGFMEYTRKEYISREEYEGRQSRGLTEKGDLLFTTEAPMGNAALCDLNECSCGQRIITFKEYTANTVIPALYMYFILSPAFQQQLLDNCTGTTAKGIKADKLKHFLLPLPPLAEQKRIVAKLEEILPLCDRLK